jgi:hypothetical protein
MPATLPAAFAPLPTGFQLPAPNPPYPPAVGSALARAFLPGFQRASLSLRLVETLPIDHPGKRLKRQRVTRRALPIARHLRHRATMSNIKPIENRTKPAKTKAPSKRIRHCIDLMVSGEAKSQKRAAELAGISRERLNRALKEVTVQGYLELAVKRQLASSQAPAAATLLRLLTEARSEHVMKDCATTLLGYSGYHATGDRGPIVSINLEPAGYIVRLKHFEGAQPAAPMIDVSPNRPAEQSSAEPARKPWENGHD